MRGGILRFVTKWWPPLVAAAATIGYAVVATFIIVKVVDVVLGIRVSATSEEAGLDLAVHGEAAYQP